AAALALEGSLAHPELSALKGTVLDMEASLGLADYDCKVADLQVNEGGDRGVRAWFSVDQPVLKLRLLGQAADFREVRPLRPGLVPQQKAYLFGRVPPRHQEGTQGKRTTEIEMTRILLHQGQHLAGNLNVFRCRPRNGPCAQLVKQGRQFFSLAEG